MDIADKTHQSTINLFPQFRFIRLNILQSPALETYDVIINLSTIYLFDDVKLRTFFSNISQSLKSGGKLILDSAGSPDNFLSYLIHDCLLKWEQSIFLRTKRLFTASRIEGLVIKHHGFRHTDDEIVTAARQAGLKLQDKDNYAYLTEFQRSYFLNKLIAASKTAENAFNIIGKYVPYIRMFCFNKT